jgi:hypothetical protein
VVRRNHRKTQLSAARFPAELFLDEPRIVQVAPNEAHVHGDGHADRSCEAGDGKHDGGPIATLPAGPGVESEEYRQTSPEQRDETGQ